MSFSKYKKHIEKINARICNKQTLTTLCCYQTPSQKINCIQWNISRRTTDHPAASSFLFVFNNSSGRSWGPQVSAVCSQWPPLAPSDLTQVVEPVGFCVIHIAIATMRRVSNSSIAHKHLEGGRKLKRTTKRQRWKNSGESWIECWKQLSLLEVWTGNYLLHHCLFKHTPCRFGDRM